MVVPPLPDAILGLLLLLLLFFSLSLSLSLSLSFHHCSKFLVLICTHLHTHTIHKHTSTVHIGTCDATSFREAGIADIVHISLSHDIHNDVHNTPLDRVELLIAKSTFLNRNRGITRENLARANHPRRVRNDSSTQ